MTKSNESYYKIKIKAIQYSVQQHDSIWISSVSNSKPFVHVCMHSFGGFSIILTIVISHQAEMLTPTTLILLLRDQWHQQSYKLTYVWNRSWAGPPIDPVPPSTLPVWFPKHQARSSRREHDNHSPLAFWNSSSRSKCAAHRSLHHVMGRNALLVALRDMWQGTKEAWSGSAITYKYSLNNMI